MSHEQSVKEFWLLCMLINTWYCQISKILTIQIDMQHAVVVLIFISPMTSNE